MKDESFKDFVLDQLADIPGVRARRMFSGYGLYSDDVFFAIISDDILYFKTNEKTRARYITAGMKPFAPSAKQILKNYYEVPTEALENREVLCELADEAIRIESR